MTFYMLLCRVCDEPPSVTVPMPFVSVEERGRWAAEHTNVTGHDRWIAWETTRPSGDDATRREPDGVDGIGGWS